MDGELEFFCEGPFPAEEATEWLKAVALWPASSASKLNQVDPSYHLHLLTLTIWFQFVYLKSRNCCKSLTNKEVMQLMEQMNR